jgi:hypothetical protein
LGDDHRLAIAPPATGSLSGSVLLGGKMVPKRKHFSTLEISIADTIVGITSLRWRPRAVPPHAATAWSLLSFIFKSWGAKPNAGMTTMIGKWMTGLTAVAIVSVATTMSASAQHKGVTATIPKQVCETLNVDTQNWGKQTVRVCGPPGARAQAIVRQRHLKMK